MDEKTFGTYLTEANEYFKETAGINIIGESYKDIISDTTLSESYVDQLTEGLTGNSKAEISQLLRNNNREMLNESSISGISPVASLSGPMIRKLWPTFALKNAVSTQIAKTPAFVIPYEKPYYEDAEGNRTYLVGGLSSAYDANPADLNKDYLTGTVAFAAADSVKYVVLKTAAATTDGFTVDAGCVLKNEHLDPDFTLVSLTATTGTASTVVSINKKLGTEHMIAYDYAVAGATAAADNTVTAEKGTILVRVDMITGKVIITRMVTSGVANAVTIKLRAHYSTEYANSGVSYGLEFARKDVNIGTGEHFYAGLPIEALQDTQALYQIDGTQEVLDVMTNATELQVDKKILNFLKQSFVDQPGSGEFSDYPTATDYLAIFDVKPAVGFANGPKAWREELKLVIDHMAARIKNKTHLGAGIFAIVSNPIDTQLLTNVDWQFKGGQGTVDGVTVNYNLGSYYGAYSYKIVSTEIVPQGVMYVVFIPQDNKQVTYSYWAYSYSVEKGYRDPTKPNVPALMLTKRDVLESFMPAIGAIKILDNDAGASYDPFRDVWPTVTTEVEKTSGKD